VRTWESSIGSFLYGKIPNRLCAVLYKSQLSRWTPLLMKGIGMCCSSIVWCPTAATSRPVWVLGSHARLTTTLKSLFPDRSPKGTQHTQLFVPLYFSFWKEALSVRKAPFANATTTVGLARVTQYATSYSQTPAKLKPLWKVKSLKYNALLPVI